MSNLRPRTAFWHSAMMRLEPERAAFTLIELLVVAALMVLAVGMLGVSFRGFAQSAELRSAANQFAALLRLAEGEARASGEPRLLAFAADGGEILLSRLKSDGNSFSWEVGLRHRTAGRAKPLLLVREDEPDGDRPTALLSVVVDGGGQTANHVLLLEHSGRYAALIQQAGKTRFQLLMRAPQATTWEGLITEIELMEVESATQSSNTP